MEGRFAIDEIESRLHYKYYIYFSDSPTFINPYIRCLLKMSYQEYLDFLVDNFNAVNEDNAECYFEFKEDTQRAVDWTNSMIIMNKLIGDR